MLWTLISEAFEDIFRFDSKTWRTSFALFFKPGFLTTEYFAGRRARYVQPIRLYLVTSILFFFVLSIQNFLSPGELIVNDDPPIAQTTQTEPTEDSEQSLANTSPAEPENSVQIESIEPGDLDLPFVGDERTEKIRSRLNAQFEKLRETIEDDPGEFGSMLIEIMPPIIFCLLPLFALLLKIFYLFKRMYYTEHLVLAVHNHCFLLAALTAHNIFDGPAENRIGLDLELITYPLVALYMYKSLRHVYQQSRPLTILKYGGLAFSYFALMMMGFALAVIIGLMTL